MRSAKEIKRLERSIAEIKMLSRIFQYATARRIKKKFEEIEKIKKYFTSAKETYDKTKNAAFGDQKALIKKAILTSNLRKTKKGEVIVLLTAETRYFGTLMSGLIKSFLLEYKKRISGQVDVILVGKLGLEYLEKRGVRIANMSLYHLDDDHPDFATVAKIAAKLGDYKKITIFYAIYVSVFKQEAGFDYMDRFFNVEASATSYEYLYRPSVAGSLGQLETQIIGAGFLQKLFESGLAKYAYRVRILQIGQVAERISAALDEISRIRSTYGRDIENKKQIQILAGSSLWRKSDFSNL